MPTRMNTSSVFDQSEVKRKPDYSGDNYRLHHYILFATQLYFCQLQHYIFYEASPSLPKSTPTTDSLRKRKKKKEERRKKKEKKKKILCQGLVQEVI